MKYKVKIEADNFTVEIDIKDISDLELLRTIILTIENKIYERIDSENNA